MSEHPLISSRFWHARLRHKALAIRALLTCHGNLRLEPLLQREKRAGPVDSAVIWSHGWLRQQPAG
jgi:hypothetical protein